MKKLNFLSVSKDLLTDEKNVEKGVDIIRRFSELVKDYQPNTEERAELAAVIGMDEADMNGINTVGDFMRRIDLDEIAANNPKALKPLFGAIIGIVAMVYPVSCPFAAAAEGVIVAIPDDLLAGFVRFGSIIDPIHIARSLSESFAQYKREKYVPDGDNQLPETARAEDERRTLIVIYKDNLLSGLLRKLIDTCDDGEDGIVGTRDGSVNLCAWNEQFYISMKEQIPEGVKCLFIGDIKGIDGQRSGAGIKFNGYGVSYGFSGMNAYLFADAKALANKSVYDAFLKELQVLPVPASVKASAKKNSTLMTVGKIFLATPLLVKDHFDEQAMIKKQQLVYGLCRLYNDDLEAFLGEAE